MGSLSCVVASQQLVLYTGVGASAALSAAVAVAVASLREASMRTRATTAAGLQGKARASREAILSHAAKNATALAVRSSPSSLADKRGERPLDRSSFLRFGVSLLLLLLVCSTVYASRRRCRHQRLATHDLEAGDSEGSEHTPLSERFMHKTKQMRPGTPDSGHSSSDR